MTSPQVHQFVPNKKHIAVLLYDGLCMFEFACVAEVFGLARPELGDNWYQFSTVSINNRPVKTQYLGEIVPSVKFDTLPHIDTLIIPGWSGIDDPVPETLKQQLKVIHNKGCRLVSVCSGVFVLAATGILNGKSATTHWKYLNTLAERYPYIQLKKDVLYVDNDSILTSAGSAAGLDLCLHIVRQDYGADKANSVARRLVLPPLRDGNQAQFVEQPVPVNSRSAIAPILDYIRLNIAKAHTIKSLAKSTNMSERTFLRRFKESTGTTPSNWLVETRIQYAKELLESTKLSIDLVAEKSGLGTAMTMRHHFKKRLNIAPTTYRKQFYTTPI